MYNKHIIIIISVGIHQIYSVHYLNKFILDDLRHSIINNEEKIVMTLMISGLLRRKITMANCLRMQVMGNMVTH